MSHLDDATLDDIQRDAEATARLVGAPGSSVRLRAEATARLVAEVRRLRDLCDEAAACLADALDCIREDVGMDEDEERAREDIIRRLRASAGGDP